MIQFFSPDIEETLTLPESDSGHCVRVLRLREGDTVYVADGRGHRFRCEIALAHPKHTALRIIDYEEVPNHWGVSITLAVAPTKNADRMEWLLEKAVEIGVDRIVPVRCEHSERKQLRHDRLEKIVVSAMKQSLKGVIPRLDELTPLRQFAEEDAGNAQKFVGYCDDNEPRVLLAKAYRPQHDVRILIGPEGDFSPAEISMLKQSGYMPVSFGESRLRTETAALFALQAVHIINQLNS